MDTRPVIGISMGDPCGIGAEVIVKALADPALRARATYVIFGFSDQLAYMADQLELDFRFYRDQPENIRRYGMDLVVLDHDQIAVPATMMPGPSRLGGEASMAFCEAAIAAATKGLRS